MPDLNRWLAEFAAHRRLRFVDYHAALADADGGLQARYSADGVHGTRAAYQVMTEILERSRVS